MYGYLVMASMAFALFFYCIMIPIIDYFRDPKGLRRYPGLSVFSGFTDLAFIWESHKGFRSHALLKAHKTQPVIRIGPNSLSYGDLRAIKVGSKVALGYLENKANSLIGHLWPQHEMRQGRILHCALRHSLPLGGCR